MRGCGCSLVPDVASLMRVTLAALLRLPAAYTFRRMTRLLEQALRQVEQLPESDQDAAGAALIDYLAHRDDMRLSDAQLAEVRRRRGDPNRKLVSHEEAKARLSRLPG